MILFKQNKSDQSGFSLLEMMVGMAIFLVISGAVMALLDVSQKRYKTDSQVLSAFQAARLAVDQISRDIGDAGYPPQSQFSNPLAPKSSYAQTPFAWSPSYLVTPCTVGNSCTTPGNFDIIVETDIDNNGTVDWVRYRLVGTTLFRGVTPKTVGGDPNAATSLAGVMAPYVTNVMNNASPAQIAALNAAYPGLFPGGTAVPIFTYTCDTADPTVGPVTCSVAGANNSPANIRQVGITLIVSTQGVDAQSGKIRAVSLNGMARRINPNQ
jgi:prepilin-type N-terminal cleavage/methylation domain-containing protein